MRMEKTIGSKEHVHYFEVHVEGCSAKLAKGQSAEDIPSHVLVMDTGRPWVPESEKRHPKNQEELDTLYIETIKRGIIDHHGIDTAILDLPPNLTRRCATQMIADFPTEVLEQIKKRSVSSVTAHYDSDLDSICSTYLAKALIQSGDAKKMPKITELLAKIVNLVDYGRYDERDPQKYAHSLSGLFGGVKQVLDHKQHAAMETIWTNTETDINTKRREAGEVAQKYTELLLSISFELLNACEQMMSKVGTIDLNALDPEMLELSEEVKNVMRKGIELTVQSFEDFDAEYKNAEQTKAKIKNKEGQTIEVPLLIFGEPAKLSPLAITNISYQRMPPETIIAVYGGAERKNGGDHYDIGMKTETTSLFDLQTLLIPMNAAEAEARKIIFPNLEALARGEEQSTVEQQILLERWRVTPDALQKKWRELRKGFEHVGHGDPTVVVAGGSLLAASNTALVTREAFIQTIKNTLL